MEALSASSLLQLGAIILAAAILRGVTGFGFSLAAVPLLSLFISPQSAVVIAIVLQVSVGFRDVVQLRHTVDRPAIAKLSIGALGGTPLGVALLQVLDPAVMRIVLAATVCGALPILMRRRPEHAKAWSGLALPCGFLAGFFGGLAAMPGPPAIFYFLQNGSAAVPMRASLMVFFFVTSLIAAPGLYLASLLHWPEIALGLAALPIMLFGTWLGGLIFRRSGETHYRRIALVVLVAMALASAIRGLADLS